jgi:hypothetical protein
MILPRAFALAVVALALAAGAPARTRADEKFVAVLELTGGVDRNVTGALTDRVRAAAADALRGRFKVISRDEIANRLTKNGRSCDVLEGACSVDLGRIVGADLVLTGRALPVSSGLELALQLHDSLSGALVSSATVTASGPLDALDRSAALTEKVLAKYLAPPPPIGGEASGTYLEVRAIGWTLARMKHSGDLRCGAPCRGNPAEVVIGFRSSTRWAYELLLLDTEYFWNEEPYALRGRTTFFGLGADWSPEGSRWFSVAAGAGVTNRLLALPDPDATREVRDLAPAAHAELRLSAPLRTIQVGLRAGARVSFFGNGLESPAGTRRLVSGPSWEFPLTLSIRLL